MTDELRTKTLVMLVGPTAIGKSTIMNEAVRQDGRFSRVRSFTTRPPRLNDEPGHYFYLSDDELKLATSRGKIITDVVLQATGDHYGTLAASFGSEYCLLDTLSGSVETYRALPFKRTVTISMTTEPDAWRGWLHDRYPQADEQRAKRLQEAVASIEWSLAQTRDHQWLVNDPNDVQATAERLIDIAVGANDSASQPSQAPKLLEVAQSLL